MKSGNTAMKMSVGNGVHYDKLVKSQRLSH